MHMAVLIGYRKLLIMIQGRHEVGRETEWKIQGIVGREEVLHGYDQYALYKCMEN